MSETQPDEGIVVFGITLTNYLPERANHVIANFDLRVHGIEIRGCVLIRTPKNGLAIAGPRLEKDTARRSITFTDDKLRHAIQIRATAIYLKMGGTSLPDWALNGAATAAPPEEE
jgi:hypothetical protein